MITHKHWLTLILLLYLLLGAAYSWIVPLGEAPDEVDHFLYVRVLLEERAFPVMHPVAADNETMEANQPPLFYLLNAAVTAPFPMTASADLPRNACFTFDPYDGGRAHFYLHDPAEQNPFAADYLAFRAARLVSVLLGAIAVILAYSLGRQLVPGDGRAGLLAAGILAFNPQFLFMMASVNNDVLTAVLGAAIVYFSIRATLVPATRLFALLGGLVGLGLLTKFALLAFWPLPILAAFWPVFRERLSVIRNRQSPIANRQSPIANLLLVLTLPLLIAGWWYVRAYLLYGDPLAWDVHLQAKGSEVLRAAPLALADLREFVVIHFQSYWAWFGWLKIKAPDWAYGLLALFVATATIGVILQLRDLRLEIKQSLNSNPQSPIADLHFPIPLLFNLLAIVAIYASLLRYILTINWSGYQGRLAFAAAAPIAALLALGWWWWGKNLLQRGHGAKGERIGNGALALPVLGLLLFAVGSLGQVAGAFPRPALYAPPADILRRCVTVAGLEVEALTLADGRSGETLLVTPWLYGRETAVSRPLQLQVIGRDGQVVGQIDDVVGWTVGDVWQHNWSIPLDVAAKPTLGWLRLGPPGALADVAPVIIRPERPLLPRPQHPLHAEFGEQLRLVGYDWQEGQITLYWQALAPMTADYTTFIHVLDTNGALVAQADGQPQGGAYPTSVWQVGEFVADEKGVMVEEERPLRLLVGVYLLETGERLLLPDGSSALPFLTLE